MMGEEMSEYEYYILMYDDGKEFEPEFETEVEEEEVEEEREELDPDFYDFI